MVDCAKGKAQVGCFFWARLATNIPGDVQIRGPVIQMHRSARVRIALLSDWLIFEGHAFGKVWYDGFLMFPRVSVDFSNDRM